MLLYYMFRQSKAKQAARRKSEDPVLNDEDEEFLRNLTEESKPPPLPERPVVISEGNEETEINDEPVGKDAQFALMNGAQDIPLPETPDEQEEDANKARGGKSRFNPLSYFPRRKNKSQPEKAVASEGGEGSVPETEVETEEEDVTKTLDKLNLAAINNRVFSLSQDSQELLQKFNQIVKDLINGVPTAYDDLENLLTDSEQQLRKMFGNMPPFLQALIRSLPAKVATTMVPEILVAASEKPGADAAATADATASSAATEDTSEKKKEKKSKIPSLKSLVAQQGAVAGMLRSILNFLRLRWPAFMGSSNILLSLALFVLLFVFWYCHKRGRETRLSREQADLLGISETSDIEASDLEVSVADIKAKSETAEQEPPSTTFPESANTSVEKDAESNTPVETLTVEPSGKNPEVGATKTPESATAAVFSAPMPAEVPLPSPDEKEKHEGTKT